MLVTLREVLADAEKGGYAVGAFNVNSMEIIQSIITAAKEERSPVILQASQGALAYAGLENIVALVNVAVKRTDLPIVLHLDHGTDFDQVMRCIREGFSSVMFDGSKLSLEKNISETQRVMAVARAVGVTVEAELGKIAGVEDDISVDERDAFFTNPAEAERFVRETGIDALAVAIGTAHGPYKGEPKLDFPRLEEIREVIGGVPLVMHGASGIGDEAIREGVRLGIRKINIDTDIRQAFIKAALDYQNKNPDNIDTRKMMGPAREAMTEIVRTKMRLFGSAGKA